MFGMHHNIQREINGVKMLYTQTKTYSDSFNISHIITVKRMVIKYDKLILILLISDNFDRKACNEFN